MTNDEISDFLMNLRVKLNKVKMDLMPLTLDAKMSNVFVISKIQKELAEINDSLSQTEGKLRNSN